MLTAEYDYETTEAEAYDEGREEENLRKKESYKNPKKQNALISSQPTSHHYAAGE